MKSIEVVAAIIKNNDTFFCAQRNEKGHLGNKWEFPGGKIEKDESPQEALVREIKEELQMDITVGKHLITVNHTYPEVHVIMHAFLCEVKNSEFILNEHMDARWLRTYDLDTLDWAAADIPIVIRIKEIFESETTHEFK